ncbi:MAG: YbjQ family protein [Candidatus Aenigmarchaeota archaeon]|nr:YbjQ family protein [Candidatus Aenigmarchaeota archaeon]
MENTTSGHPAGYGSAMLSAAYTGAPAYNGDMIVSTTFYVPGYEIVDTLGSVMGNTVRTRWFGQDIWQGIKSILGGELKGYTELYANSRREAEERCRKEARDLGANAIIDMTYDDQPVLDGTEFRVTGTAVVVKKTGKKTSKVSEKEGMPEELKATGV